MKMQTLLTTAIGLMLTIESNAQDVSPRKDFGPINPPTPRSWMYSQTLETSKSAMHNSMD